MDYQFLSQTMLFSGESPEEIKEMLSCLGAVTRSYGKGEIIYHAGECVHSMGLVLSGNVQIESDDVWGNHSVLDDITPGFFFAETYASLSKEPLMVNVVSAAAKTEVLFLNIGRHPALPARRRSGNCRGHREPLGAHHRGAAGFRQAHGGEPHGLYHRGGGERA